MKKVFSIKCLFCCLNLIFCVKIGLNCIYIIFKCFIYVFEVYLIFFLSWKNDKDCLYDKFMLCILDEYLIYDIYFYFWFFG